MNPSLGETAGINLPPPVTEHNPSAGQQGRAGEAFSSRPESLPAAAESAPRTGGAQTAALPALPQTSVPAAGAAQGAVPTAQPAAPAAVPIKDDNDSIEKEWVNKAKQIVERTRDDPYRQSEELTVVKADYMKQRYNKTVKIEK